MATNVSRDEIIDGIVGKVQALKPAVGAAITSGLYLRSVGRFMGRLDSASEAFQKGIAGRTPCALVGPDGAPRRIRTTIGRRVDRIESSFQVVCFSDKQKSRDARAVLLSVCEDVRRLVTARRLGLEIQPLMYAGESTELDSESLMGIAVKFTTKHRVDYTLSEPTYPEMATVWGEIVWPEDEDTQEPGALLGEVSVIFE